MTTALVIPCCRAVQLASFLDAWASETFWDALIVVEDGPTRTFATATPHHYSWEEIDAELQDTAWVISRRDSAIRSFGFWKAYQLGYEHVVTLDDDCHPLPDEDFLAGHLQALHATPQWTESVPRLRTRGLPYADRGVLADVMLNMGLWTGVPDFDAPQQLVQGTVTDFTPPDESRVLPRGQYVPICGMNLCFRRAFAPLAYFPLQGEGWPYRRFDDIWFGVTAKKICDHLGWNITLGRPWVRHTRASDVYQNLVKEAPGIGFNERFWRVIDAIDLAGADSATACMRRVGQVLATQTEDYLRSLGAAIQVWAGLFEAG
jgi:reversibly glycosylated polypeptide / UDP-arabinopyranose mutase